MNSRLNNKHSVYGDLGDFWYRQLAEDNKHGVDFARSISHIADANHAVDDLGRTMRALTGRTTNFSNNIDIKFNPADVRVLSLDLQKRVNTPTLVVTRPVKYTLPNTGAIQITALPADIDTEPATSDIANTLGDSDAGTVWFRLADSDRVVLFDTQQARPLYFVPIPLNINPLCVHTTNKELTVNCSFLTNKGYILFYEDPAVLFPNNIIVCRCAEVSDAHIMDYTYQVDNVRSDGRYIAAYMRATHSPVALRRALSEVAGIPIVHADSVVQGVYENQHNVVYELDTQTVVVPLHVEHTQLSIGDAVAAGTILGAEYINVYSAANTTAATAWYRHADLNTVWTAQGLPLTSLTPFGSIIVTDAVGTFSSNGIHTGGTAHLQLSGITGGDTGAYWNFVKSSEGYTNKFIADIPGVTAGATANGVDFYFDNMLTFNAMVIVLRTSELGDEYHQNVMSFIKRDLPINVTPIIIQ